MTVYVNSSDKERIILDLRRVNQNIVKSKVKFENHTQCFKVSLCSSFFRSMS